MLGGLHVIRMFLQHIVTKYGKDEYEATVVKAVHTIKLSYTLVVPFALVQKEDIQHVIMSFLCSWDLNLTFS